LRSALSHRRAVIFYFVDPDNSGYAARRQL